MLRPIVVRLVEGTNMYATTLNEQRVQPVLNHIHNQVKNALVAMQLHVLLHRFVAAPYKRFDRMVTSYAIHVNAILHTVADAMLETSLVHRDNSNAFQPKIAPTSKKQTNKNQVLYQH
jgi:hypothetical protein